MVRVNLHAARKVWLVVFSTHPSALGSGKLAAQAVAEHAIALMLALAARRAVARLRLRLHAGDDVTLDLAPRVTLDLLQLLRVVRRGERNRDAGSAGAAGAQPDTDEMTVAPAEHGAHAPLP